MAASSWTILLSESKKSYQKTSEIIKRKRVKNIWLNGIVIFTNMTGKKKKRQK